MNIIYMGTPTFAVPALRSLIQAGHRVGYVISQPDAAAGRGKKVKPTPVKEKALESGLTVLQPERLKGNEDLLKQLRQYEPDFIVVAAYGQILPEEILTLPALGCINIHASLLPRFRGAAPIQRAIMEGDKETGITIMFMEKGLDTGDMLAKRCTPIQNQTSGQLHDVLANIGAELLIETLPKLEAGTIKGEKQKEQDATYAPMISKQEGEIDFTWDPEKIERLIRAFDPWPGAFTTYKGKSLKIWQAQVDSAPNHSPAGTITKVSDEGIEISAGGKTLIATTLQLPGKKRIKVKDFLRGNSIEKGLLLG